MKTFFYNLLQRFYISLVFIWELPQNIAGILVYLFFKIFYGCHLISIRTYPDLDNETLEPKKNFFYDNLYIFSFWSKGMSGGVTLGQFVFLDENSKDSETSLKHEGGGHGKQGLFLGPLYLIVVGLSSILHAAFHNCKFYYHFWTETWADILGDVKRVIPNWLKNMLK